MFQTIKNIFQFYSIFQTRQLNYADITSNPTLPGNEMRIRGLENKTVNSDVDLSNGVFDTLDELNSEDEDFVEIEDLEIFSNRKIEIDNV